MKRLMVLFCGILMMAACGDDASDNNDNTGKTSTGGTLVKPGTNEACGLAGRAGETDCLSGELTCQAGQYCNVEMVTCSVGCTSDNNCAGNQFCDMSQGSPGICLNCVVQTQTSNNSSPQNHPDPNDPPSNDPPDMAACNKVINAGVACGLVPADQAAAAKTLCTMEESADSINSLLTCINFAEGDCAQIDACGE